MNADPDLTRSRLEDLDLDPDLDLRWVAWIEDLRRTEIHPCHWRGKEIEGGRKGGEERVREKMIKSERRGG